MRAAERSTAAPGAQVRGGGTLCNVQALRGVAALIVVAAHFSGPDGFESRVFGSEWTSWSNLPANTGVDLFFVISGFIMVITTWQSFDAPGSARRFLWRRVTRIYPLYWVATTAILLMLVLGPDSGRLEGSGRPDVLASYLLLPQEGRYPVLVAWSLVHEMYFYLLFTASLMLPRRWFGGVMAVWTGFTLALHVAVETDLWDAQSLGTNPFIALMASPINLEFVLGVAVGYAVIRGWVFRPREVLALGVLAAVLVLAHLAWSGWSDFPSPTYRVWGPGVVAALLVYGAVGVEVKGEGTFPVFAQRLGDWSYSLYLVHVPLLSLMSAVLVRLWSPGLFEHVASLFLVPAVVVFCAYLTHALVERPLQNYFRRRGDATGRAGKGLAS